uniref:STPAP polymerase n=1 Tax=Corvus moneduloides TaxID=1196302 RepID=A0A8U7NGD9_CORMO
GGFRGVPSAPSLPSLGLPQVEAQLALLVRALELSAAERRLRALLLALLREALGEFLPGCSLVPYGSSVNGFDVHGCDLDLHLELGGRDPPPEGTPAGDGDPQGQGTPGGDGDPQGQGTPGGDGDPQGQGTPGGDGDPQGQGTPGGDGDAPPNGSLLGSNGSLRGDEEPLPKGSFLGSHLGSGGSLFGDRDPSLEESLLGSEGSHLGSEGSHLGSGGSHLGSEGSLLGDRDPSLEGLLLEEEELRSRGSEGSFLGDKGSLLGSEGSHLGSEGSLFGSEGSLLGDEAAPPAGSLSGSEGSLSGSEGSPQPEGSLLGRGAPPEQVLALVGAVLRRCVPGVRGVRAVPSARHPVVKFSHKQSGLAGDVCLDNRLALFNTRFLRLCADADPRVRPLGYAVRLWAGGQRLAGNRAGGGPLLTNYALTLLVVLFLQSRSPPVLPSVRRLRALAGPRDCARVGGWDCSFPRDAAELEPSGNTQSAASLLAEFFSYFGTLDLGGLLLSPLEGRALPRPPPETLGGLRPGPLTLQDPFELSHNVAANVTPRTVSRFVRCCRDAARLCRGPEFLQKSRRGRPWGVMRLLLPGNPGANPEGKFLIPVPLRPPGGPGGVPHREACAAVGFVLTELLGCGCEPEGDPGLPGAEGKPLLDPSEPPPGSRCHPEGVTGDSRGEFGVPGTPEEEEEEAPMDTERPPAAP